MRKLAWVLPIALWLGLSLPSLAAPMIYENGTRSTNPNEPTHGFHSASALSISASFSVSVAQTAQSVMFASAFDNDASLVSVQWAISTAVNGTGTVLGSGSALVTNFYMNTRSISSLSDYLTTFSLPSLDLAVSVVIF